MKRKKIWKFAKTLVNSGRAAANPRSSKCNLLRRERTIEQRWTKSNVQRNKGLKTQTANGDLGNGRSAEWCWMTFCQCNKGTTKALALTPQPCFPSCLNAQNFAQFIVWAHHHPQRPRQDTFFYVARDTAENTQAKWSVENHKSTLFVHSLFATRLPNIRCVSMTV